MKKSIFILLLTGLLCSCSAGFISDKAYKKVVTDDFNTRRDSLKESGVFNLFDKSMPQREKEALMFLYAYMPLGDLADYPSDLYLKSVNATFVTQNKVSWGKTIPEDVFRHFVLPLRVNNEYLDSARYTLFSEIYPRIKDMSMYDAALEVNHWCHEKVIYRPTNSRTASPLASMKTGFGRCGEESVFAVAALRSVGIPARQVYTPRWAHTDDNHAWVEVWIDGEWYYMGACEPEPELNIGWFSKTVQRGVLMHTKAFGKYNGTEPTISSTDNYTEINITSNYAPTATAKIKVTDLNGIVADSAKVSVGIYNYAEFYPVFETFTSKNGECSILAGKGDLMVWASQGDKFGFKIVSVGKDSLNTIVLEHLFGEKISAELDINPPKEGDKEVIVSKEKRENNLARLNAEDIIRNNYINTFIDEDNAEKMVTELGYSDNMVKYIMDTKGNWQEVCQLIQDAPEEKKKITEAILGTLLDKDLRDIKITDLQDHINFSLASPYKSLFNEYILAPRVAFELISPYKEFLQNAFGKEFIESARKNPRILIDWVRENIEVNDKSNSMRVPVLPLGVFKTKAADSHSRDIFFVALCRSFGIPARVETVTGKVQYFSGSWSDVSFNKGKNTNARIGYLTLKYRQSAGLENPLYDTHFTISKYEDGKFRLLNFRNNDGFEGTASYKSTFNGKVSLDEGYYMLSSGTRMASGKVLSAVKLFKINSGETTTEELIMREDIEDVQVIGNINPEQSCALESSKEPKTILDITGRGYFVIAILGAKQEPTSHLLRDIAAYKERFENWDRKMVMLFKNEEELSRFDRSEFPEMPSNMVFGIDIDNQVTEMISKAMKVSNQESLPIIIIGDTFGRVVYFSQGYKIGGGEQLLKVIDKL